MWFKTTAEHGERGQQWRAMEDCSTDERLQQETLCRRQWTDDWDEYVKRGPHAGTYFFLHQPLGPYRPSTHLELSGDDWGGDTPPPRPGIREREKNRMSNDRRSVPDLKTVQFIQWCNGETDHFSFMQHYWPQSMYCIMPSGNWHERDIGNSIPETRSYCTSKSCKFSDFYKVVKSRGRGRCKNQICKFKWSWLKNIASPESAWTGSKGGMDGKRNIFYRDVRFTIFWLFPIAAIRWINPADNFNRL